MSPRFASVGRLINSVTHRQIGTVQALATPDVDNVRIGRSDSDGADGLRRLVVKDRLPGSAIVVRFPHAAVHLADVENIRLGRHTCGCAGPPTAKRPNHAPAHLLVRGLRNLLGFGDVRTRECKGGSKYDPHKT